MRLLTVLFVGIILRLAIAPFFAHPLDVYTWFNDGQKVLSGQLPLTELLVPYFYSFFLFVIPAALAYAFVSPHIPNFTISMASLDPRLNPGPQWNIQVVPGIAFDFIVKLPLILSDVIVAVLIYKIASKKLSPSASALASAVWFLNPLSIWISSGWGTFDTLPALFSILMVYSILEKQYLVGSASLVASIAMKSYAVVFVPVFFILVLRSAGRRELIKNLAVFASLSLLLFLPKFVTVTSDFVTLATQPYSPPGLHYSGLSLWTAITLFYAGFSQQQVASVALSASLIAYYFWFWKRTDTAFPLIAALTIPVCLVLLFYPFVGENFYVWLLPFLPLLAVENATIFKLTWLLGLIAFISSITNSLLPYYMLPLSSWLGARLGDWLGAVSSYKVSQGGAIVQGLSPGKLYLAFIGILASVVLITIAWKIFATARSPSLAEELVRE